MERKKLTPNVTPNTLESMIEYTLISSTLNRIYEMTKRPLEYPRNDSKTRPPPTFAQNQNMENKMEKDN